MFNWAKHSKPKHRKFYHPLTLSEAIALVFMMREVSSVPEAGGDMPTDARYDLTYRNLNLEILLVEKNDSVDDHLRRPTFESQRAS